MDRKCLPNRVEVALKHPQQLMLFPGLKLVMPPQVLMLLKPAINNFIWIATGSVQFAKCTESLIIKIPL